MQSDTQTLTRRRFLALVPPAMGAFVLAACGGDNESSSDQSAVATSAATSPPSFPTAASPASGAAQLSPTPACSDGDDPTLAQTEGPFFTPSSPERASLIEAGVTGTRLVLEGYVFTRSCQPISRALVDFWQCDDKGVYDNSGYKLRGHQFTDASGRYRLETIVPALYPGRTRHIHVKVQAPNRPVLTSQLYFPNEAQNRTDGIFNQALVLDDYRDAAGGKAANFDFVLNIT